MEKLGTFCCNDADDLIFQGFDGVDSPNDMMVEPDEFLVEAEDEKDDIAIINPDQLDGSIETLPKRPRADDCKLHAVGLAAP